MQQLENTHLLSVTGIHHTKENKLASGSQRTHVYTECFHVPRDDVSRPFLLNKQLPFISRQALLSIWNILLGNAVSHLSYGLALNSECKTERQNYSKMVHFHIEEYFVAHIYILYASRYDAKSTVFHVIFKLN